MNEKNILYLARLINEKFSKQLHVEAFNPPRESPHYVGVVGISLLTGQCPSVLFAFSFRYIIKSPRNKIGLLWMVSLFKFVFKFLFSFCLLVKYRFPVIYVGSLEV